MSVIGITGGIASGKSTFCRMLACKIDAEIFDADAEAKMLLERDPDVREAVTKEMQVMVFKVAVEDPRCREGGCRQSAVGGYSPAV